MKSFKLIASKAGRIVFEDRLDAECPREAREKMKTALGLESLTGVVYAITEIPVDVIREIVTAQLAGIVTPRGNGRGVDIPMLIASAVEQAVSAKMREIETRLSAVRDGTTGRTRRFDPMADNTATPEAAANEPQRAITGPDWRAIKRHYLRTRSVKQTAAQFDISPNTLKARIRREGWGR